MTPLKAFRFRLHPGIDAYEEYDALMPEAADVHAESYAAPPVEYGAWLYIAAAWLHAAAAEETACSWRPGILAEASGGGAVIGSGGVGIGGGLADWVGGGGGGDGMTRTPQSVQSVPRAHEAYAAPGPPSSQVPSDA